MSFLASLAFFWNNFPHPLYNIGRRYHLSQGRRWPPGEGLFKINYPVARLKCFNENLLIRVDDLDGRHIKMDEVFPQRFIGELMNVEEVGDNHLSVSACYKLMN